MNATKAAKGKTDKLPVPPPKGAESALKAERDARIDQHALDVLAHCAAMTGVAESIPDPKKDGIPVGLQVQNRKEPTPEQKAKVDAAKATADAKAAHQQELRAKQDEAKKKKARVRVEKLKAKKGGEAAKMPLTGTAALKAIADAHIAKNGDKAITKVPTGITGAATDRSPGMARLRNSGNAETIRKQTAAEQKAATVLKPAAAPKRSSDSSSSKARYDWAGAEEKAAKGTLANPPDFSAETHKSWRAKLEAVVKMARTGDIKGLKAFKINPTSTSPKAIERYRQIAIKALQNKTKG